MPMQALHVPDVQPTTEPPAGHTPLRETLHHVADWWRTHQFDPLATEPHPDALLDRQQRIAARLHPYEP